MSGQTCGDYFACKEVEQEGEPDERYAHRPKRPGQPCSSAVAHPTDPITLLPCPFRHNHHSTTITFSQALRQPLQVPNGAGIGPTSESTDLHPLADKAQSKHHHRSPSLCIQLHPEPLRSLYSGTTIPGGRGFFPDLVGHFS